MGVICSALPCCGRRGLSAPPPAVRRRYLEALQQLYDAHKEKYHKGRTSDMRFVE